MEDKREEIMQNLVNDRLVTLRNQKARLEEQMTETGQELQEVYFQQRRDKLAEIIKEIKILEDEETETSTGD